MEKIELPKPTLIVVGGTAGTGKTTLIDRLVQRVSNVCIINKDDLGDPMLSTHHPEDEGILRARLRGPKLVMDGPEGEFYRRHLRDQIYLAMLCIARTNLRLGNNPIIEGNYTGGIKYRYFREIFFPFFEGEDAKTKLLFCYADKETLFHRLRERGATRDLVKTDSEDSLREYLEGLEVVPAGIDEDFPGHLKVDTTEQLERTVELSIRYLLE